MTTAKALPAVFEDSAAAWERALFTFLSEKQRRSARCRSTACPVLSPGHNVVRSIAEPASTSDYKPLGPE